MSIPRVSVIVATLNGSSYLECCLDSIRAQSLKDCEIIVVDNGSSDDSVAIARKQSRQDDRIRLLHESRKGVAYTLNAGISASTAAYVAILDQDDSAFNDRLELQYRRMLENPDLAVLGAAMYAIDSRGRPLGLMARPVGDHVSRVLPLSNCIIHSSVMMKKETWLAVGGYTDTYGLAEDYDLWLRISECARVDNLREAVGCYRIHDQQVSGLRLSEQAIAASRARHAYSLRKDPTKTQPLDPKQITGAVTDAFLDRAQLLESIGDAEVASIIRAKLHLYLASLDQ